MMGYGNRAITAVSLGLKTQRWSRTTTRCLSIMRSHQPCVHSIRANSQIATSNTTTTTTTPFDPKIDSLVESISQLTLLETADLVDALKTRLGITEVAMPVATAGGQPVSVEAEEEAAAPKEVVAEKSIFNIKLEGLEAANKAKIIKEVKGLLGLNLVEAKKLVESAPKVIKENVVKDDAEAMKKTLEGLGAKIVLE